MLSRTGFVTLSWSGLPGWGGGAALAAPWVAASDGANRSERDVRLRVWPPLPPASLVPLPRPAGEDEEVTP